MEAIRGRLKYRAALKRALPAEKVDADAVGAFWRALSREARLEVLRFEDAALVQQIQSHMKALCHSELWHSRNSGGGGAVPRGTTRLVGFGFEVPAERNCMGSLLGPTAFCATPEFVEVDDILDYLKENLGSDFMAGRPAFHRDDWVRVVDTAPNSWQQLQAMGLRLVELALLEAQQSVDEDSRVSDPRPIAVEEAQEVSEARSAKGKSRKKKSRAAANGSMRIAGELRSHESEGKASGASSASKGIGARDNKAAVADNCQESVEQTRAPSPVPSRIPSAPDIANSDSSAPYSWSAWITNLVWNAPEVNVDIDAVRDFWCSLDLDERLAVLRIEDSTLVQRLHQHLKALCEKELWNKNWGASAEESESRLTGFGFECPVEPDWLGRIRGPDAFCAEADFARNDNLLDDLEQRLGSPFMVGRPVLPRNKWSTIVETTPESWSDLQHQVLRLVELAVLQAQQDAVRNGKSSSSWPCLAANDEMLATECGVEQEPAADRASIPGTSSVSPVDNGASEGGAAKESQRKKQKARKKKKAGAALANTELQEPPAGELEFADCEEPDDGAPDAEEPPAEEPPAEEPPAEEPPAEEPPPAELVVEELPAPEAPLAEFAEDAVSATIDVEVSEVEPPSVADRQNQIITGDIESPGSSFHFFSPFIRTTSDAVVADAVAEPAPFQDTGSSSVDARRDVEDTVACASPSMENVSLDAEEGFAGGASCGLSSTLRSAQEIQQTEREAPLSASSAAAVHWSSWVSNAHKDEWDLVKFQPHWSGPQMTHAGARAVVKNTFFHIDTGAAAAAKQIQGRRTSRSCHF